MPLVNIIDYFENRFDSLGYTKWPDGFNISNIPETIIDKAYHILVENIGGEAINHTDLKTESDIRVSLFFKGYRDVSEAVRESVINVEIIVKDICNIANRTSMLLDVVFEEASLNQLAESNDNTVLMEMKFKAKLLIGVEE